MDDRSTGTTAPSPAEIKDLGYELKEYFKQLGHTKTTIPNSHYHEVAAKLLGSPTYAAALNKAQPSEVVSTKTFLEDLFSKDLTFWSLDSETLTLHNNYPQEALFVDFSSSINDAYRFAIKSGFAEVSVCLQRPPFLFCKTLEKAVNDDEVLALMGKTITEENFVFTPGMLGGQAAFMGLGNNKIPKTNANIRGVLKGIAQKSGATFDHDEATHWALHLDFCMQASVEKSVGDSIQRQVSGQSIMDPVEKDPRIIHFSQLETRPATGSMILYPEGAAGVAIFFNSSIELNVAAERFGVPVCVFHRQDGGTKCEGRETWSTDDEVILSFSWFRGRFNLVILCNEWDPEIFIKEKQEDCPSGDWVEQKKSIENTADEISDLFRLGAALVTIDEAGVIAGHKSFVEGVCYDTHTYRAGLFVCQEDWDIDWSQKIAVKESR